MGWFSFILGIFNPIAKITGQIADAKVALAKAETDQERIHAQERVSALQARQAVLVAEASTPINAIIRAGFALPFVVYNAKLILWDKIIMHGSVKTDPLSPELYQVELACLGFYFLYEAVARFKR